MDLTMLAPGNNTNAVGESPVATANRAEPRAGEFQLNLDGQQVSNMMACARWGQPRFSRDAIGEFEFISSRFDATQGRSICVQANAVTRAGTNNFSGLLSGYFRDDDLNAKDFIFDRVLPYSNQQISTTFGGPIRTDRNHFFVNYEFERDPQTYAFNGPYPRFNVTDLTGTRTEHKSGVRSDNQLSQSLRLMTRANLWRFWQPYTDAASGGSTGGNTLHPSRASSKRLESNTWFANFTKTFGNRIVNELKPGYNYITSQDGQVVQSGSIRPAYPEPTSRLRETPPTPAGFAAMGRSSIATTSTCHRCTACRLSQTRARRKRLLCASDGAGRVPDGVLGIDRQL